METGTFPSVNNSLLFWWRRGSSRKGSTGVWWTKVPCDRVSKVPVIDAVVFVKSQFKLLWKITDRNAPLNACSMLCWNAVFRSRWWNDSKLKIFFINQACWRIWNHSSVGIASSKVITNLFFNLLPCALNRRKRHPYSSGETVKL